MDGYHLSVVVRVSDAVNFVWDTVLCGSRLFVQIPEFIVYGSKERYGMVLLIVAASFTLELN